MTQKTTPVSRPPMAPDVSALKSGMGPDSDWHYVEIDDLEANERAARRWARLREWPDLSLRPANDGKS